MPDPNMKKKEILTGIRNIMKSCGVRTQKGYECEECSLYDSRALYDNLKASLEYYYLDDDQVSENILVIKGPEVRFKYSVYLEENMKNMRFATSLLRLGKIYEKAQKVADEVDKYLDILARKKKRSQLPNGIKVNSWKIPLK
jgi:hypothetical protein